MNWYFKLIANHPFIIIFTVGIFSVVAFIISIICAQIPNFSDPQLGFETRGTEIAKRIIAWDNLYEATRPSGTLTVNPLGNRPFSASKAKIKNDFTGKGNRNREFSKKRKNKHRNNSKLSGGGKVKIRKSKKKKVNRNDSLVLQEDEKLTHDNHDHDHLSSDGFFCEGLSPDYSHIVLETSKQSLLSLNSLLSICEIQERLMNNDIMDSICQTFSTGNCCQPWSISNYVSLINNRTTCFNITEVDVMESKTLLLECVRYYNNLRPDCHENNCRGVPTKCTKFNIVYNILHYLTDIDFLHIKSYEKDIFFLNQTMLFLPIARSSAVLPYYYNLTLNSLEDENVHVSAMDFGLKNALFNDCLVRDAFLMVAGLGFVILCIWSFTNSLLITLSTVMAIVMSLLCSYFVYTFVFKIKFFPFMNVLAIVVVIGIGADDIFIFYKMWECAKADKKNSDMAKLVSETVRHSSVSMFVTSLTTAAAFYSNYISSITAINCFSIFAGTAVLVNFLLTITWVPACFVISEKIRSRPVFSRFQPNFNTRIILVKEFKNRVKRVLEKGLISAVICFKWVWVIVFVFVSVGSAFVVLYYPKFKLPDSSNFHLFQSSHFFERYDAEYREKFQFERKQSDIELPLRFVWGILPIDNGNFLEPDSKGTLEFDPTFNMAEPESQVWLLDFCLLLRSQPFYRSTLGPLLLNCFIELFKNWMGRRCKDITDIDRTPCCESSRFPYSSDVFNTCIVEAIADLYETPTDYFLPGVAGPKFSKTEKEIIKVVVVEFDSNYSFSLSFNEMQNFFIEVETWFQKQLSTAPPGMKNGWFISHLGFYDLQLALSEGTVVAIGVSMAVSLAVFFFVSLNILISAYTILTITCIIFFTVAVLVLMGWSLNVLESIAVTTAIGLTVDFSLHYGINYRLAVMKNCREAAVRLTLTKMGAPTLMAALTTGAAGLFMLPSSVLPYIQIGIFLLLVMGSSWLLSTIFLMSILCVMGPRRGYGQFSYKSFFSWCRRKKLGSPGRTDETVYSGVLTRSLFMAENVTGGGAEIGRIDERYELESLTSKGSHKDFERSKIESD